MPTVQQQREKLVSLLKELFQLDQPDLNFGFYRIMHAKAKEVTAFLENDLLKIVEEKSGQSNAAKVVQLQKAYEDAVAQAKSFGAVDPDQTDPVKRAKAALEAAKDTSRAEGEVYDHLYRFFERYYDSGDFMSRRYLSRETSSKAAPYAVPYDGSEVYLHWANKDQYYIKTTEYLTDFTFDPTKAPEVREVKADLFGKTEPAPMPVHFRVAAATEGEHGNIKASDAAKRYFILHKDGPVAIENGELIVRFEYRPDSDKTGQDATWQAKRNEEAVAGILEALDKLADASARGYSAILRTLAPTDKQKDRSLLAKYVVRYTARNTMDYFIHKDLGDFLRRELDFYIKNEVMRLDDIESVDAPKAEQYLAQIKVLRQIAGKMIDFLAQLEDFQKKLWLKKKFVVETHYCTTLDRVPDELYPEIAANVAQRQEWVRLFAINEIRDDLTLHAYSEPLAVEFLRENRYLVVDTIHFPGQFVEQLLSHIGSLSAVDGVILGAECFHGLMLAQHAEQQLADCVIIDPPYNTGNDGFPYKDSYQRSSWYSMMEDRVALCCRAMRPSSLLACFIDDNEVYRLGLLLNGALGEKNRAACAPWRSEPSGGKEKTGLRTGHEYILIYHNGDGSCISQTERSTGELDRNDKWGPYRKGRELRKWGGTSSRADRPNQWFPLRAPDGTEVYPIKNDGSEGHWRWGKPNPSVKVALQDPEVFHWEKCAYDKGVVVDGNRERWVPFEKIRDVKKSVGWSTWLDSYGINADATRQLKDLFGFKPFDTPKPLELFNWLISLHSSDEGLIIDPFAGSGSTGHAVINANIEDGATRRYMLLEHDYRAIREIIVPRLKKVAYSRDWRDGKPASRNSGIGHTFKYIRLESYEDCLNNLELKDDSERNNTLSQNPGLREDYVLHYMLDVETRGSASLLNIDRFADPTAYKLKVKKPGSDEYDWRNVDLLETFNYLIGLRVEHVAAPQAFTAQFDREKDPDLPKGQLGRLVLKGRLKQDPNGPWWFRKVEGWVPKNPGRRTMASGRRC